MPFFFLLVFAKVPNSVITFGKLKRMLVKRPFLSLSGNQEHPIVKCPEWHEVIFNFFFQPFTCWRKPKCVTLCTLRQLHTYCLISVRSWIINLMVPKKQGLGLKINCSQTKMLYFVNWHSVGPTKIGSNFVWKLDLEKKMHVLKWFSLKFWNYLTL